MDKAGRAFGLILIVIGMLILCKWLRADTIPPELAGGGTPVTFPYYGLDGHVCDGYDGPEWWCVQTIPKPYVGATYVPPVVIVDPPYLPPPPIITTTPEPRVTVLIGLAILGMLARRRRG